MKVLITGCTGFVGRYLMEHLIERGHEVIGITRRQSGQPPAGLNPPLIRADINDPVEAVRLLRKIAPDAVVHLAAQSNVKLSWEAPEETMRINAIGPIGWIKAIAAYSPMTRFLSIGSGEEYGLTGKTGKPLTESDPCLPQNPYAISKYAIGQTALQLAARHGLSVVHLRAFNHFGPGQREGFVVSDFASQIARIERALEPPVIRVGDLSAQRDFTDVRDVVRAYTAFIEQKTESGIYNVCSGTPRSIHDILKQLLQAARIPIAVEVDPSRFRPADVPVFVGSAEKTRSATRWCPAMAFERSLSETLNWWREAT